MCQNWINLEKQVGVIIEYIWKIKNCKPQGRNFLHFHSLFSEWAFWRQDCVSELIFYESHEGKTSMNAQK